MSLKEFLYHLQYEPDKTKPQDMEVDWENAPLPYKLYRHLPVFPLPSDVPLDLTGKQGQEKEKPTLRDIGYFLWHTFGLAQLSQSVIEQYTGEKWESSLQLCRRFVPSGGGLYPSEMYMYLKLEELPCGIYHYDAAHHRLILLREGHFDSYVGKALGNRCDVTSCFAVAFVSTVFWKNFFKYNNFSYRLQGLDAGLLLGQLHEVAKRFDFETGVYFQFLDRAINHLLGLPEAEESVYAVIPLAVDSSMEWFHHDIDHKNRISSAELCSQLPIIRHDHFMRSRKVLDYPMLTQLNEASLMDTTFSFKRLGRKQETVPQTDVHVLPQVNRLTYDLAEVCRQRYSPEIEFVLEAVSQSDLAALLQEVMISYRYRNDLDGSIQSPMSRVKLFGCFYGVEGIRDGAYLYDEKAHTLQLVRAGDQRPWLQNGMSLDNLNLFQVPLSFHVAGDRGHLHAELGYRGYRIQQMETGMLVQRLLLAACASGMEGRPLLGFDVSSMNELYGLTPFGQTSLIQIPVGPCRSRSRLEGSLSQ
ncbi:MULTISPECIES: SagB family peptide dehydrogenase [unclassified Paenibacillus]|uniref:SagB family peptide dehydrogenase n=1 Tax=unclassified Paenibacillus TaxID=185978 RepID=UPI00104C5EEF|nr:MULTISPECIES: SagB family peptide dehydrogenase [unclassified Paenibacillus]NIK72123.1 SagB-type dehydrogenase family enzyme [Paenibacillus sp. BK720]TCM88577.1 SagB-type dehydrogenase family enzyme [Paenibacillus sp. BK033]